VSQPLRAPLEIGFDYTRSLGPTLSRFMTALAGRRILGSPGADGLVHAPPFEYDPVTLAPPAELVEVGPEGTVTSWSWMPRPIEGQPLDRPFGWALIRLDGADTAMLHAVDAGAAAAMRTGMRVRPRWAASTVGDIRDIACFEPCEPPEPDAEPTAADAEPARAEPASAAPASAERASTTPASAAPASTEPASTAPGSTAPAESPQLVTMITTPVRLHYEHVASPGETRYLRALAAGRLIGERCPACGKVYIPPRGACPADGVPTGEEVDLADTGTVTTFCVVNVNYPGQRVAPPYVAAAVLLDGADIAFQHLILGCPADEVRMGMRVKAVWRPREQWGTTPANIDHFRPAGEPDAPYESYARHL
jgi:uncharacterized OB-fold protein